MLPVALRVTRSEDFTRTIGGGQRAGRRTLVVHLLAGGEVAHPSRAGLVVSRAVGGSVVRHRVSRRLRHLLREELGRLPGGMLLVIRALPAAATAEHAELRADLSSAVRAALRRATRTVQTGTSTVDSLAGTSEKGVPR